MDTKSFLDHVTSRISTYDRDMYLLRLGCQNSLDKSKWRPKDDDELKQSIVTKTIEQYMLQPVEVNFILQTFPSGNPFGRGSDLVSLLDPEIYTPERLEMVYNSDNIHIPHDKQLCEQLKKDLEFVAVHDSYPGAWSFIGALCDNYEEQMYYMEKSAREGSADGMVAYAQHKLGLEKDVDECLKWMRQAAAMDQIHALMFMALSYHYGSITPLNRDMAYKYYKRCTVVKYDDDDWAMVAVAYNNLGVMLAEAGYFRTAQRYLEKMVEVLNQNHSDQFNYIHQSMGSFFVEKTMLPNLKAVKRLLEVDIEQRMELMVVLQPDNRMKSFVAENGVAFPPITAVFDQTTTEVQRWLPADMTDFDEDDLREVAEYDAIKRNVAVSSEDTIVLRSTQLYFKKEFCVPNQSEVIFFETTHHKELNKYLYSKYRILYNRMQKVGFWLNFPPLTNNVLQDNYVLSTYVRDRFRNGRFMAPITACKPITDYQTLFNGLVNREDLPSDCAGFLLYDRAASESQGRVIYDITFIPTVGDVNYDDVIESYLSMLEKIEFEGKKGRFDKQVIVKPTSPELSIPKADYTVVVEKDYKIFLRSKMGKKEEVKLSVLSKVIYLLYLNHLEGISFKSLVDYRDELWHYYRAISVREPKPSSIDAMVDPTNNSVNEKVSRIKRAIADMIGESSSAIYAISGEKGSVRRVMIDASQLEWNASRYAK